MSALPTWLPNLRSLAYAAAPFFATITAASAAPITWETPVAIRTSSGNSADVSATVTLVEAFNAAISSYTGGNRTVNGVTFVTTNKRLPSDTTGVMLL